VSAMVETTEEASGRRAVASWSDLVLAVVLTVLGQVEVRNAGLGVAVAVCVAVQTAAVLLRRSATVAAAVLGAAGLIGDAVLGPSNTLAGLLAGLLIVFSVARNLAGRRLWISTALITAAVGLHQVRLPSPDAVGLLANVAFAIVFTAAVWGFGRVMRRRELEHDRLTRQAREADERAAASTAAAAAAVLDERARIARELHDTVAHGITVMVVQAGAAEQLLDSDPDKAHQPLETVRRTGQESLAEMRRLLHLLRTSNDDDGRTPPPSLKRLPELVSQLREAGLPVDLCVEGDPVPLPPGVDLCVYRVVQEALTNSLRHAGPSPTTAVVRYEQDAIHVTVTDTGPAPIGPPAAGGGHGLVGMRERVLLYGGTVSAEPAPDGGFVVRARIPVSA